MSMSTCETFFPRSSRQERDCQDDFHAMSATVLSEDLRTNSSLVRVHSRPASMQPADALDSQYHNDLASLPTSLTTISVGALPGASPHQEQGIRLNRDGAAGFVR